MEDHMPPPIDDATAALMDRWIGNGHDPSPGRAVVHQVAQVLRETAATLVAVDAEEVDLDAVQIALGHARDLQRALTALPRVSTTPAVASAPVSHLSERSPVTGLANPVSSPLRMRFGTVTTGEAVYTEQHEGPAGGVHGGIVAAALDEILGVAQMAAGRAGYTGSLQVRYLAVTPLHTTVTYEAGVDRMEGRRLHMWARSHANGHACAEATGIFVIRDHLPVPGADSGPGA
jgi:acyl-coenzyme A thioesterase PaaI-like protein